MKDTSRLSENQLREELARIKRIKRRLAIAIIAIVIIETLIIIPLTSTGQPIDLTYSQSQDELFASNFSNNTDLRSYQCQDGTILRIGDPLVIGRPSANIYTFTYLFFGKLNVGNAMLVGIQPLGTAFQAEKVVIDRIYVTHTKMSKKSPLLINMYVRNPNAPSLSANRTVTDYEKARMLGEVINPNAAMTRDEAIKNLKEAKDLLDLQIITQGRYDTIKANLTPIITGN